MIMTIANIMIIVCNVHFDPCTNIHSTRIYHGAQTHCEDSLKSQLKLVRRKTIYSARTPTAPGATAGGTDSSTQAIIQSERQEKQDLSRHAGSLRHVYRPPKPNQHKINSL